TSTAYDDTGITPNVVYWYVYWYKVRACNAAGCSAQSAPDSGYAQSATAGAPPTPVNVSASDGTYTDRVRVTWDAAPGADRYEVWRSTSYTGSYTLQTANLTATTYDDTNVTPGTTYYYKVRACSGHTQCGCGGFSIPESGYACTLPAKPTFTLSYDPGNGWVEVTWTMLSGLGYKLFRATAEAGPYTDLGFVTSPYYDTTVQTGSTYWYKLRVCNACGCTDSDPQSITP
ncbi:fibronectin type III domain-containing protein, partial [Candidatus Bipolaricaulota bacterium]|nr:fibronectin type III domain-containing protein [Candidatus Bipolaricaulota bacterium]